jgi:hypothetical protein
MAPRLATIRFLPHGVQQHWNMLLNLMVAEVEVAEEVGLEHVSF